MFSERIVWKTRGFLLHEKVDICSIRGMILGKKNIYVKKHESVENMLKKLIWVILLLVWAFLVVISHADAKEIEEEELYAKAAVLMDADSGRVLYGKNENEVLAMASTTKIMTCIIALENGNLSDVVEISSYAASMPEVKLGMKKGEKYRLEDLLYSLMLESHNDTAVAIAEHIGREMMQKDRVNTCDSTEEESKTAVAAFVNVMNQKAEELGCRDTWFITPNGLDGEELVEDDAGEKSLKYHQTTAAELARIMAYCITESAQAEQFLQITQTDSHSFGNDAGRSFYCTNHNAFLTMMPGVLSGKTGFTTKAGYCYVGALEDDGRKYVVALLACGWPNNKTYKWADTRKLMEYGIEEYHYRSFTDVMPAEVKWLSPLPVRDGQTERLDEQAYVELKYSEDAVLEQEKMGLLMRNGEEIKVEYSVEKELQAPVREGQKVGEVRYIVDENIYYTEEIVTAHGVEVINWRWCWMQIFLRYLNFG